MQIEDRARRPPVWGGVTPNHVADGWLSQRPIEPKVDRRKQKQQKYDCNQWRADGKRNSDTSSQGAVASGIVQHQARDRGDK
jgi:hypothetical protein